MAFCPSASPSPKGVRDAGIDIDAVAESLHTGPVPSKIDKPLEFIQPLTQLLIDKLNTLAPAKRDSAAIRKLQEVNLKLNAAKAKLRQAGIPTTPERSRDARSQVPLPDERQTHPTPELEADENLLVGPGSVGSVAVPGSDSGNTSTKRSAAALGASSKKKAKTLTQRSLPTMFSQEAPKSADQVPPVQPEYNPDECLEPKAPSLRSYPLTGTSVPSIKKWMDSFPVETQQMAKKILELLKEKRYSKERLQTAVTQYGIPIGDVMKLTPNSLQSVVSIGAAMSA